MTMQVKDHVKFVKAHHAMHADLERFEGRVGVILAIKGDRAKVRFGSKRTKYSGDYWIRMDRLEQ